MFIPKQFASLAKLVDRSATRFAFWGIELKRGQDGQASATATDARKLLNITWNDSLIKDRTASRFSEHGACDDQIDAILAADDFVDVLKSVPRNPIGADSVAFIGQADANNVDCLAIDKNLNPIRSRRRLVDGRFPKWQDVIPSEKAKVEISVDPRYLAETLLAIADCCGKRAKPHQDKPCTVTLEIRDDATGIVIRSKSEDGNVNAVGIVMPCSSK